jgi:hypothetical protein
VYKETIARTIPYYLMIKMKDQEISPQKIDDFLTSVLKVSTRISLKQTDRRYYGQLPFENSLFTQAEIIADRRNEFLQENTALIFHFALCCGYLILCSRARFANLRYPLFRCQNA